MTIQQVQSLGIDEINMQMAFDTSQTDAFKEKMDIEHNENDCAQMTKEDRANLIKLAIGGQMRKPR